jgi:UDP-N-acetylglucosamine--N-acetylmuramyl-(pentapeptide) pyrophosphoryl-undecaprenol N-acetylglucosamine transferase
MAGEQRRTGLRVIVAGGGTGGHLFPGIAIASELKARSVETHILFVVGRKEMETEIVAKAGFRAQSIDVEGVLGRSTLEIIRALFKILVSSVQSFFIVKTFKPDLIVGVGGYSSGPLCLVGRLLGIPTAIHEQNSFPGLTNRILAPLVKRVFISFEGSSKYLRGGRLILSGNPVRDELLNLKPVGKGKEEGFVVLVMGGSQGAHAINRAVLSALKQLKERGLYPFVIHQTGRGDFRPITDEYRADGFLGEVVEFIEDMARAYARADLVISRAGATTIAELAALGKPSILVPYPYAAHNHQEVNARVLSALGGADMILEKDLDGMSLASRIRAYMENRDQLERMSSRALKAGRPRAKEIITQKLLELVSQN